MPALAPKPPHKGLHVLTVRVTAEWLAEAGATLVPVDDMHVIVLDRVGFSADLQELASLLFPED